MRATVLGTGQNKNVEYSAFPPTLHFHSPLPTPHPQTPVEADVAPPSPSIRRNEWASSILVPTCHMQQSQVPAGYRVWTQPAWEGGGYD